MLEAEKRIKVRFGARIDAAPILCIINRHRGNTPPKPPQLQQSINIRVRLTDVCDIWRYTQHLLNMYNLLREIHQINFTLYIEKYI